MPVPCRYRTATAPLSCRFGGHRGDAVLGVARFGRIKTRKGSPGGRWSKEAQPRSTIVYLVGHGTDNGLQHNFIDPPSRVPRRSRPRIFARCLVKIGIVVSFIQRKFEQFDRRIGIIRQRVNRLLCMR